MRCRFTFTEAPLVANTPPSNADKPAPQSAAEEADIAALAKGGRTNVFGFILRLLARIPFLFIAGQMYGAAAVGRFAYAILIVEFVAQLATLGLRRGLANELAQSDRNHTHVVWDGLAVSAMVSIIGAAILITFPQIMFPNSEINGLDRFLPLIIVIISTMEIALAALAYRYDIKSTVRSRAIVEPWTISIAAGALWYYSPRDGLILAYVLSMVAAMVAAFIPLFKSYGWPHQWKPRVRSLLTLMRDNAPLAAADAIEWGSRRVDLAILGLFVSPAIVGLYYMAQQIASLPQKLKSSFEPILGPVITRNLAEKNYAGIARQVAQVGFWIIAAQIGVGLALGIPSKAILGVIGAEFVGGTLALWFLLGAEAAAAPAVVSEAALIYMARHRNLMLSLVMIGAQAGLTFIALYFAKDAGWEPEWLAAIPAAVLMLTLGMASLAKRFLLMHLLGHPIRVLRWPLLWATLGAAALGYFANMLPDWAELVFGVPAILGVYLYIIWTKGFGPDDRALFKKQKP